MFHLLYCLQNRQKKRQFRLSEFHSRLIFVSALTAAFGQTPPGVTITEELVTFDNADLTAMKVDNYGLYKTISGKIFLKNKNNMKAVLKLTGGPVKNLEWKIDTFDVQKDNEVLINADGTTVSYNTSKNVALINLFSTQKIIRFSLFLSR